LNIYIVAQMVAKDPELMENRIFNIAFVVAPTGQVIHKHYKTAFYQKEPNTAPSDIWNLYLRRHGDDPVRLFQAVFPVARTEIGNIGTLICAEGSFPEAARGLALNGAEIIWRTQYPEPWMGNGIAEIQNRAHAVFNNCYVLAPNIGSIWFPGGVMRMSCGKSQIIDYRGTVISEYLGGGETLVKDLRVEEYKTIYDAAMARGGIYPKNLCMDEPPLTEADQAELVKHQINKMVSWGVFTPPKDWHPYAVKPEVLERVRKADAAGRR
jgi:predicted amidohydrolase